MYEWLAESFGDQTAVVAYYAIICVAILIGLWLLRLLWRALSGGTFVTGGNNRKHRLAIIDATAVDNRRRLVLVRRDDVEHLVLIGGMNDVVIERDIQPANLRQQAALPDLPPATAIADESFTKPVPASAPKLKKTLREPMTAGKAVAAGAVGGVVTAQIADTIAHIETSEPKPQPEPEPSPEPQYAETTAIVQESEIETVATQEAPAVETHPPLEPSPVTEHDHAPNIEIADHDSHVPVIEPIAINEAAVPAPDQNVADSDQIDIESVGENDAPISELPVDEAPPVDEQPVSSTEPAPTVDIDHYAAKVPEIEPIAINDSPAALSVETVEMEMEIDMTPEQLAPDVEVGKSTEADIEDEMEDLLNQLTGSGQN